MKICGEPRWHSPSYGIFPRALPQIVDNVESWLGRMEYVIEVKRAQCLSHPIQMIGDSSIVTSTADLRPSA